MPGEGATITYGFMSRAPDYGDAGDKHGFVPFTEHVKALARAALAQWSAAANLTFFEVEDDGDGGQIRFGRNHRTGSLLGYAHYPPPGGDLENGLRDPNPGDIYVNKNHADIIHGDVGSFGFWVYVHELGHALGLKHPHDYGDDGGSPILPTDEDHTGNTIMSYNIEDPTNRYAVSYNVGEYDKKAIQYLYGPRDPAGKQIGNLRYGEDHDDTLIGDNPAANAPWGSAGDDVIIGNLGDHSVMAAVGHDHVRGRAVDDALSGNDGDDTLSGGDGADSVEGGAGADLIDGGAGEGDYALYWKSPAAVTVNLKAGTAEGGDAAGDTLLAIEDLQGSVHDDHLTGTDRNNALRGRAGDDTLRALDGDDWLFGGLGADSLDGGDGWDTVWYHRSTAGVTVNLATGFGAGGHAEGDTLAGIERIIGSSRADLIIGDDGDNVVTAWFGNDALSGGGGDDTLHGWQNQDHLVGGTGDDTLVGGTGDDTLDGGIGVDTLSGGDGDDYLIADQSADGIDGGVGDDTLPVSFDHTLAGGAENLVLIGSARRGPPGHRQRWR